MFAFCILLYACKSHQLGAVQVNREKQTKKSMKKGKGNTNQSKSSISIGEKTLVASFSLKYLVEKLLIGFTYLYQVGSGVVGDSVNKNLHHLL